MMTIPMITSGRENIPASGHLLQQWRRLRRANSKPPRLAAESDNSPGLYSAAKNSAAVFCSRLALAAAFGCLLLAGCNQNATDSAAVDDNDAMLNELLGSLDTTPDSEQPISSSSAQERSGLSSTDPNTAASGAAADRSAAQNPFPGFQSDRGSLAARQNGSVVQAASTTAPHTAHGSRSANVQQIGGVQQAPSGDQAGHRLELRLSPGDQFPLIKTVTQNLVQKSAQWPASADTHLELHMHMRVEDTRTDGILMSVRYTRIVYRHDLNGQQLAFDSGSGRPPEAAELLPYAGMVNNGFAFWLGRDNRIRELVGYQEFLQRCVQQVPATDQQQLLQELAARFGDNGVASFVDEAIGLLPYSHAANQATMVSVGDVWFHERHMTHPVPLTMKSTCRLLAIDGRTAEIDLTGRITQPQNSFHSGVQVRDGRSMGSCVIDQATGLPLRLNRSTYLNMLVAADNGQTVEQEKRVETTIQTLPATSQNNSRTASTASHGGMQQAASQPQPVPTYDHQLGANPQFNPVMANPGFQNAENVAQPKYPQPAAVNSATANQQYGGQQSGVQQVSGQQFGMPQNGGQQYGVQQVGGQVAGPQSVQQTVQQAGTAFSQPSVPVPAGLGLPFGQKREDVHSSQGNGFGGPTPLPGGPAAAQLPSTVQAVYPD